MKLSLLKTLTFGVAVSAISLCNVAQAQMATDTAPMAGSAPMADTTTMATTSSSAMMPMPVSGTILRYYVNRAGYVTAMDVQASDGVKLVRFSPSMAQNLTSMYPVGANASVYVTQSMMGGMTRYDLAGMGADMPAPGSMMMPMMVSDVDLLKAEPFTTIGAAPMRVKGKLTSYIADPMNGEVLAIVLDGKTLVRVPRESRLVQASMAPEGIRPLVGGASVVAYGYPEAPRYGSVSPYEMRLIGTGIAINGRNLGALGFGRMAMGKADTLLGFNAFGGTMSKEESSAMTMGYGTYTAPGTPSGSMSGGMNSGTMAPGTMDSGTMNTPATTPAPAM